MPRKEQLLLALTALGTVVLCHFLFSPYGFNPTDEGFVLSSSMRLLDGQVPHVDFSSLRPLGYAYLHIPELLIDRDHTFLVSRFVFWLEMSGIAYVWTLILLESSKYEEGNSKYGLWTGVLLFFITFLFNAHDFPNAVLHTIDGLLFALIGFYILIRSEKFGWLGGLFIGYAVLCKQGYAVLLPLLIVLYPEKRKAVVPALFPGIVYVAYVSAMGGWDDLQAQLTAHTELLDVGILNYALNPWLFGGILLNFGSHKLRIPLVVSLAGMMAFAVALLVSGHYHGQGLLLVFGYAVSESFFDPGRRRLYGLALTLAWCVSISVGYASIALFSGGLLALLLLRFQAYQAPMAKAFLPASVLAGIVAFVFVRNTSIYRDAPRTQLTYPLDGLVEGASGIYTNGRTLAVLKELDSLQEMHPGLLALPDYTACQLFDPQRPVLTEWPNRAEIPNARILQKVSAPMEQDTTLTIAVARYQAAVLADTLQPAQDAEYRILQFLNARFTETDSTRFFRIYRPK